MPRTYFILLFLCFSLSLWAQSEYRPARTVEEEARKQTCMLMRQLNLTDSLQLSTLYHLHLRFARLRRQDRSREQAQSRRERYHEALQTVLTPDQYSRFIRLEADSLPRRRPALFAPRPGSKGDTSAKP